MDTTSLPARIAQMAAITQMERGHLSVIRTSPDGQPYYNLQRRENGRNVTEYIPRDQVPAVQENIAAYESFTQLVDEHLNEVSGKSREERKAGAKKRPPPSATPSPKKTKSKNSLPPSVPPSPAAPS